MKQLSQSERNIRTKLSSNDSKKRPSSKDGDAKGDKLGSSKLSFKFTTPNVIEQLQRGVRQDQDASIELHRQIATNWSPKNSKSFKKATGQGKISVIKANKFRNLVTRQSQKFTKVETPIFTKVKNRKVNSSDKLKIKEILANPSTHQKNWAKKKKKVVFLNSARLSKKSVKKLPKTKEEDLEKAKTKLYIENINTQHNVTESENMNYSFEERDENFNFFKPQNSAQKKKKPPIMKQIFKINKSNRNALMRDSPRSNASVTSKNSKSMNFKIKSIQNIKKPRFKIENVDISNLKQAKPKF